MEQVPVTMRMTETQIPEPRFARVLWADTRLAPVWAVIRLYLAWQWLTSGWAKLRDPQGAWVGPKGGTALQGFVGGALKKTAGAHPDVMGWYARFLQHVVLPHARLFAGLVTYGEFLVGLGLLLGFLTGLAAFFGLFMNTNYLLAGSVSINPVLVALTVAVLLAWRVAGYWGLDRWVLPYLGVLGVRDVRRIARERRAARRGRPGVSLAQRWRAS